MLSITVVPIADTAALVRRELRGRWPGVDFSVTRAGNSGARARWLIVSWVDGPTAHQVDGVARRYRDSVDYAPDEPATLPPTGRVVVYEPTEFDYRRALSPAAHDAAAAALDAAGQIVVPRLADGSVDWTTARHTEIHTPVVLDGRVIGHPAWFSTDPPGYTAILAHVLHRIAADTDHTPHAAARGEVAS